MWIVAETESLLARQRADWDPKHPENFERRLATLDPFLLYTSCLQALKVKWVYLHSGAEELAHKGQDFVQTEIARLQAKGTWLLLLPSLDQLF